MAIQVLGISDSVTSCECCGKSNLKKTIALDVAGAVAHYGVNCAARTLGFTDKTYTARDAASLVTRVSARDKSRKAKDDMIALAESAARTTGEPHVVIRRFSQGATTFNYCSEASAIARNRFGDTIVHTAHPAPAPVAEDPISELSIAGARRA